MGESRITVAEFMAVLEAGMPSAHRMGFDVVTLEKGHAVLGFTASAADLRPGDTVAGPTLFALADLALYAAVMTSVGAVPLAVTTDATVHFLRRPQAGRLLVRARLLKEGARLVVGEAVIAPASAEDEPVMHAVMTYSVPPKRA
jgi:acyl-coenzyme A thioesterase PaaI-like protein